MNVPLAVGVPEINPLGLIVKPGGKHERVVTAAAAAFHARRAYERQIYIKRARSPVGLA